MGWYGAMSSDIKPILQAVEVLERAKSILENEIQL